MEFLLICLLSSILIKTLKPTQNKYNNQFIEWDKTIKYINQNEEFCRKPILNQEKKIYCDIYKIQKNFITPKEQLKRVSTFLLKNKSPIHHVKHIIDYEEYESDENEEIEIDNEIGRYEYDPREHQ